jgi:uncharacterized protein YfdQ (DUF2303 family)
MATERQNGIQSALAYAKEHCIEPKQLDITHPDGTKATLLLRADGSTTEAAGLFAPFRSRPERRSGTATHTDLDSFIAHVDRFMDEDSAIFAVTDRSAPRLLAVLDYHRIGSGGDPRFGCHRSSYAFPLSDEWEAWTGANKKAMSQRDFAEFMEGRIVDIIPPPETLSRAAKILVERANVSFAGPEKIRDLARGILVHESAKAAESWNNQTGEREISYENTHATSDKDNKPLKVPGAFLIGIPLFTGGEHYELPVRLRYRVAQGQIVWFYELAQAEAVFDDAIRGAIQKVRAETDLPVFLGTPE